MRALHSVSPCMQAGTETWYLVDEQVSKRFERFEDTTKRFEHAFRSIFERTPDSVKSTLIGSIEKFRTSTN
jgi:hypothetical protein